MSKFSIPCQGVIAIEGKVLRRSFDKASGKSPLHMVSAWGADMLTVPVPVIDAGPHILAVGRCRDVVNRETST